MTQSDLQTLFWDLTGEPSTGPATTTRINRHYQSALEAFNRRVHYRYRDETVSVEATTQEYALPSTVVEVLWVEWSGSQLEQVDEEQFRREGCNWRTETMDNPTHYYLSGRKIGFYPRPNAAGTATLRCIGAPGTFNDTELAFIGEADHRILAYYASAEWLSSPRRDPLGGEYAKTLYAVFESETGAVANQYRRRALRQ